MWLPMKNYRKLKEVLNSIRLVMQEIYAKGLIETTLAKTRTIFLPI